MLCIVARVGMLCFVAAADALCILAAVEVLCIVAVVEVLCTVAAVEDTVLPRMWLWTYSQGTLIPPMSAFRFSSGQSAIGLVEARMPLSGKVVACGSAPPVRDRRAEALGVSPATCGSRRRVVEPLGRLPEAAVV